MRDNQLKHITLTVIFEGSALNRDRKSRKKYSFY